MTKFKVTNENYYGPEAEFAYVTNSQRKTFLECPAQWMAKLTGDWEDEPGEALLMGQYIDLCVTEPDKVGAFLIRHAADVFKYGKEEKGKKQAWADLDGAIDTLRNEPFIMQYLTGDAQAMFAIDDFHGVRYKCKLDVLSTGRFITDLKTCKSLYETIWSPTHKERVPFIDHYGYWTQLALYREAVRVVTGDALPCYIVAVEKKPHYDRELFHLDNIDYLESEAQFAIEVFRAMEGHKEAGDTADDLPRCGKCKYCVSTKSVLKPKPIQPKIKF